jgi:hypothetical protein
VAELFFQRLVHQVIMVIGSADAVCDQVAQFSKRVLQQTGRWCPIGVVADADAEEVDFNTRDLVLPK